MIDLVFIITAMIGATMTYYISHDLNQGAVRASASLALCIGLFFYCFPDILDPYLSKNIEIVFIGSTFIGMTASKIKRSYIQLAVAGGLFSIIYINKNHLFVGFGGALGALAFIALLATMGSSTFFTKGREKLVLQYRKRNN